MVSGGSWCSVVSFAGPWFDMYLEYRDPLVLNHNPFLVFKAIPELANQVHCNDNRECIFYVKLLTCRLMSQLIWFGHLYATDKLYLMVY